MALYQIIHQVLKESGNIMTLDEIYDAIVDKDLFTFGVKVGSPQHVIRIQITRRSFNSPRKDKQDEILFYQHDKLYYGLYEWMDDKDKATHASISEDIILEHIDEYSPNAELLDTSLFLEQEWHRWLYKNLEINGLEGLGFGKLRLFDPTEQEHKIGKFNTGEVGEIDLLLRNDNVILVIELKRKGIDDTVGQILRYVGWVEEHLKKPKEKVYGVIVAQEIDKKLHYAIKVTKDHIFYQQLKMNIELGESSFKKEN
jgi:hypothetical protein